MQPSIADLEKRIANLEKRARRTKLVLIVVGLLFFGLPIVVNVCLDFMVPTDLKIDFGTLGQEISSGYEEEAFPSMHVPDYGAVEQMTSAVATDENGDSVSPSPTFTLDEMGPTVDLDLPFNKDQFGADIPAR